MGYYTSCLLVISFCCLCISCKSDIHILTIPLSGSKIKEATCVSILNSGSKEDQNIVEVYVQ